MLTVGLNGIAEEMFYRGALWSVVADSNPIVTTTLVNTAATAATRNLALVLASTATGLLFGYQRRATGGTLGPDHHPPDLVDADASLSTPLVPYQARSVTGPSGRNLAYIVLEAIHSLGLV